MRDTLGVIAGPAALARHWCWIALIQSFNSSASHAGVVETARVAKAVVWDARRGGNSPVIGGRLWQDRQELLSTVSTC